MELSAPLRVDWQDPTGLHRRTICAEHRRRNSYNKALSKCFGCSQVQTKLLANPDAVSHSVPKPPAKQDGTEGDPLTTAKTLRSRSNSNRTKKNRPSKGMGLKLKPFSRRKISLLIRLILGLFLLHGIYDVFSKLVSSLGRFNLGKPLDYIPPLALLGLGLCFALTSSKK
jgi:hypothetical protein